METELRELFRSRRTNARIAWLLVVALPLAAVAEFTDGDPLWAGFAAVVTTVVVVPPIAFRDASVMLPWEVVAIAALPVGSRALITGRQVALAGVPLTGRVSTYLAVAAVALVVAVELDAFTRVRMTKAFAVVFVAVVTTAAAGVWALVRWGVDRIAGTAVLLDGRPEDVIEHALMLDFVAATVAGIGAGVLFEFYFRRGRDAAVAPPASVAGDDTDTRSADGGAP